MEYFVCGFCNTKKTRSDYSGGAWRSRISKSKQGVTNFFCSSKCRADKYASMHSERMTRKNPMLKIETREKVSATLKKIGHKPPKQGGNGRGMTAPQKELMDNLGDGWFPELVIVTGNGYFPTHYKIDIGNPVKKIAIEVDGRTHNSPKARAVDIRKELFLSNIGYKTLRFKNSEVTKDLALVLSTIAAEVKER